MTIRLIPENMVSNVHEERFMAVVRAIIDMGWERKLIYFDDGTVLFCDIEMSKQEKTGKGNK